LEQLAREKDIRRMADRPRGGIPSVSSNFCPDKSGFFYFFLVGREGIAGGAHGKMEDFIYFKTFIENFIYYKSTHT